MELLKEVGQFIWAVLTIWQAYMTGGIVIALLGLYERVTQKTVSLKTFIVGVVAFLLVAFFLAWRDQYHATLEARAVTESTVLKLKKLTEPDFELNWGTSIVGSGVEVSSRHKEVVFPHIFLPVMVINHGAPSIIKEIEMTAKLKNGNEVKGLRFLPNQKEMVFNMPDGPRRFAVSDSLFIKGVASPIPTGGQVSGHVYFRFPPGSINDFSECAEYILEIRDINGKSYPEKIDATGRPKVLITMPGVLPLH